METKRLRYLFSQYLNQSANREETQELMHFLADPDNKEIIKNLIDDYWDNFHPEPFQATSNSDDLYEGIVQKLPETDRPVHKKFKISRWPGLAAAASFLILLSVGIYFLVNKDTRHSGQPKINLSKTDTQNIAAPSSSHAILTLGNGTQINLDSIPNGSLGQQGNSNIQKLANGRIAYQSSGNGKQKVVYNTLSVPRGSRIMHITLADGSKVWLSSASSIRYPTAFIGKNRKVEITGEVYFEIADKPEQPFRVTTGKMQVQVLGTRFNIKAYPEEATIKTTLLQGKVRVSQGSQKQTLIPGQQARINKQGQIKLVKNANLSEVMAWKNGFFSFHRAGIQEVMQELARWYDLEVQYKGNIPTETFSGEIGKNLSLQDVLNVLKKTRVKYKIEGNKKVLIMP